MILFVTGTGTDVGKTVISSLICEGIKNSGKSVAYYKPVQTGPRNQDANTISAIASVEIIPSSYNYELAASPDQAYENSLKLGNKPEEVCIESIFRNISELSEKYEVLIVEGAGGLHVPLNSTTETWFDVLIHADAKEFKIVLVADSQLGTLNHTSLSVESLEFRGLTPSAVILSGERHKANESSLSKLFPSLQLIHCEKLNLENKEEVNVASQKISTELDKILNANVRFDLDETDQTIKDDRAYCWHPFTQHKTAPTPLDIKTAKGSFLYLSDGRKVYDGISSWWVNTVGHGCFEVGKEILKQQQSLDHVLFAGATHKPAADLSKTLVKMAGDNFQKVFYSDNGSTSVEVGLKMAYQYQKNIGKNPTKFIALKGSYHGDTFGAMSVGAETGFHDTYDSLFFDVNFIEPLTTHTSPYFDGTEESRKEKFDQLENLFASSEDYAGLIIEPIIQGAGGMLIQDLEWTNKLFELAKSKKIPIIVDEVFTGLGRIGENFAFQKLNITPDIICTSKGLTGGNLPIAVTIATEDIYNSFLSDNKSDAFLHGHSYTANPIACAAANASLGITLRDNFSDKAKVFEKIFNEWIEESSDLNIENARAVGAILAFELSSSGEANYFSNAASELHKKALDKGLFIRPLGNTVYLVPPIATSNKDLRSMLSILKECIS